MAISRRSVVQFPVSGRVRNVRRAQALALGLALVGSGLLAEPPATSAGAGDAPNLIFAGEFAELGAPVDHLVVVYDEKIDPDSIPAGADFTITFDPGTGPLVVQGASVELVYAGFALSEFLGTADLSFLKVSLPAGVTVSSADAFTLKYTPGANPIQDLDGNDAAPIPGLTEITFFDPSGADEPMLFMGGSLDANHGADSIVLFFIRPIDPDSLPATTDFRVEIYDPATGLTQAVTPSTVARYRSDLGIGMLDLLLPVEVTSGQSVVLDYTPNPSGNRIRNVVTGADASVIVDAAIYVALDYDRDGLANDIDTRPALASDAFDDRAPTSRTFGSIVDRGGLDVTVTSAATGVRIAASGAGAGTAVLRGCAGNFAELHLTAGDEVFVACGSITTQVISGQVDVVLGDSLTVVSIPAGVTAEVTDTGGGIFDVENLGGGDVTVTVDGVGGTIEPGQTVSVVTQFVGFSAPVDNPLVVNVVKAGAAVPLRWRRLHADGTPHTNLTGAAIRVTSLTCDLGSTADLLEEAAAGSSGLQNLGDGYYQLNWKSPKTYANSCKTLHLDLGEGVTHDAYFKFIR